MKQFVKYGLLLIFTLILHCATMMANQEKSTATPPSYRQEKCSLLQDNPIQNTLNHLYFFHSTQSSDLGHTDISYVPLYKSLNLLVAYFCEHKEQYSPSIESQNPFRKCLDPINHYIYKFRKIVI